MGSKPPWLRFGVRLRDPAMAELAEIRAIAEKGRRIAADTHKALTGYAHPDAPESEYAGRKGP